MIVNAWEPWFTEKYGHHFPRSYMTVDVEFTGADSNKDFVLDIGHTIVEDGVIVDENNVILDWTRYPKMDIGWLKNKLDTVRRHVEGNWDYSIDRIKADGVDPVDALTFYAKLFAVWRGRNMPFILQNGITSDERMIRGNFLRYLGKGFEFPVNGYFDVGAIYKATQMLENDSPETVPHRMKAYPQVDDTLKSYFQRVVHTPIRSVKWSLSHIMNEYGLMEKHFIDTGKLHGARYDAVCVHWVMEEIRSRVVRDNSNENPFSSPAAAQRVFDQAAAAIKLHKESKVLQIQQREFVVPDSVDRPARKTPAISPAERRAQRRQRSV